MQPDDDGAAAAAGAAEKAAAPAEPVVTADMQQSAAGSEAAQPDVASAAVKIEDGAAPQAMQVSTEVSQTDLKMEAADTAAEQIPEASLAGAAGTEAEQLKAEEGLAAGQPDTAEQLDEAGEDDEVWCCHTWRQSCVDCSGRRTQFTTCSAAQLTSLGMPGNADGYGAVHGGRLERQLCSQQRLALDIARYT